MFGTVHVHKQSQQQLGLDITWDKDNGQLTWINNQLEPKIFLDWNQQSTWINNQETRD